jgi:hypothetical protein
MSDEHPNATAYRKAADAFRVGDLRAIETLIDESVVWHVPGRHRRAGDIRGRDALLAWLKGLAPLGFWLREHDVFANDLHVCALSYMGARREGLEIETRVVSNLPLPERKAARAVVLPRERRSLGRDFRRAG